MNANTRQRILLFLATVLMLAHAPVTRAAGLNLFWNDCGPGPTATVNRSFACDSNTGNNTLVASYEPPEGLSNVNGNNLIVDLQSASSPLPAWWQFKNAGSCRITSLTAHAVFSAASCTDPWSGQGLSSITGYLVNVNGDASRARIGAAISVPEFAAGPQPAGTEYYSLNIVINNARTVGPNACAGCQEPVCIVLNQILITQPVGTPGESPAVTNPLANYYAYWQGGILPPFCFTPVLQRTWGQVKGLYR